MISFRISAVLLLLFLSTATVLAQGVHTLQGRVITPSGGQPNAPVKVTLTFNGRRIHETFTDLSGRFTFAGINRGTYQITGEGDGQTFATTTIYAEVSAYGSSSQLFSQDLQLRPITGKPVGQPGVVDSFVQDVPKAARQALERGSKLLSQAKLEAGIEELQKAIKIFPDYFEAHLQLGNVLLQAGQFDAAIAELDKARVINPNDERSYQSFGLLLMRQKNYQVAVAVFEEAARLNPGNPTNALMRGMAMIHQAATLPETAKSDRNHLLGKAEIALSQASKLSGDKLKPDSVTLSVFYEMKGDPTRAADELESYLRKSEVKNAEAIQAEIKRLRAKASEAKTSSN